MNYLRKGDNPLIVCRVEQRSLADGAPRYPICPACGKAMFGIRSLRQHIAAMSSYDAKHDRYYAQGVAL